MENPYMYIFVRNDLTHPQQIVQAAHSAYEMGRFAEGGGIGYEMFFEPDIDAFTAIATHPLRGEQRKPLKRFKLKK